MNAEAEYADGTKANVTAEGQWTSSDESVVNVTRGVITAVNVGSTNVQFSIGTAVLNVGSKRNQRCPNQPREGKKQETPRFAFTASWGAAGLLASICS